MTESKYIIACKYGKLKHYTFPGCYHHFNFARDNGLDFYRDIIETGIIINKRATILECRDKEHMKKRMGRTWLSEGYMKGRELESMLAYKPVGLRDGD